ncbi:MAG: hypothetical protein KF836_12290 [Fimbriimonadaceae bacterium]|nr:hypothetical protein [Fimbriimonadaceae bacterium]
MISPERVEIRERTGWRIFFTGILALCVFGQIYRVLTDPPTPQPGNISGYVLEYLKPFIYIGFAYVLGFFHRPLLIEINIANNEIIYEGRSVLPPSQLMVTHRQEALSSQLMMQLPDGHLHTFTFMGRKKAKKLLDALNEVLPPEKERWKEFQREFNLRRVGQSAETML